MFTCKKCGKKAKTSYERTFGEKPTFEPVGFYCHTCGIFYDTSKKASKVVYGVAKKELGAQSATENAYENSCTERIQTLHKAYTKTSKNAYENNIVENTPVNKSLHESKWMGRDSNSRPPVCETGILTRLDYPSASVVSLPR